MTDGTEAILAFAVAAALLTVTPGLDTMLVLRTAVVNGGRSGLMAGAGVSAGVFVWGLVAALGLGVLLAVSKTAFGLLQIAGTIYLIYLGQKLLRNALFPKSQGLVLQDIRGSHPPEPDRIWFSRGLLTNLLNPKVGLFYVSFLPQFVPAGAEVVSFSVALASIHVAMGLVWFLLIVSATRPFARTMSHPRVVRTLEGVTGAAFIYLGIRLAMTSLGPEEWGQDCRSFNCRLA